MVYLLRVPFTVACLFLLLAGCGRKSDPDTVTVFAAASVTDVVTALSADFEGGKVRASYGATSDLARQIDDGAPADVFISASRKWTDYLERAGRLEGQPVVFARNSLVCVSRSGGRLTQFKIIEPAMLFETSLAPDERVAIADEGVPAGDYARQALTKLGLLDRHRGRLIGQKDVRAVLNAVATGEIAAGFVYATDARMAGVQMLFPVDPGLHDAIDYYVAVVKGATNTEGANHFMQHLRSETGRAALHNAGFVVP